MADSVEIKISEDLVKPILENKIKLALTEAMGAIPKLTENMIDSYLKQKCNYKGEVDTYSSSNTFTRIDVFMRTMIEEAIKGSMKTFFEENKEILTEAIAKYFKTKKGSAEIINAIQKGIVESMVSNWQYKFEVKLPSN